MQSCEEVSRGFFVACRNTSIVLDAIEEALDEIALGIECEVAGSLNLRFDFGGMTTLMARA